MKSFIEFGNDLINKATNLQEKLIKEQQDFSQELCGVIQDLSPSKTGNYRDSNKVDETKYKNGVISTFIGTDYNLQPTKWTGGKIYNLGYLLEYGTDEHSIPNAFGKGFYYGYTDEKGIFHKGTLDKNWHPGFQPYPHFRTGWELCKDNYKGKMVEVVKREIR